MQAPRPPQAPRRRLALIYGLAAWLVSVICFAVLFQIPPSRWPNAVVIPATLLSAAGIAVVLVELIRRVWRRLDGWTDRAYFQWTAVCTVLIFVVQFGGIALMRASYAS